MTVHYSIQGTSQTMEVGAEDLPGICAEIATYVRAEHAEANANEDLMACITDGVLNSLADDSEEITLKELA